MMVTDTSFKKLFEALGQLRSKTGRIQKDDEFNEVLEFEIKLKLSNSRIKIISEGREP